MFKNERLRQFTELYAALLEYEIVYDTVTVH